VYPSVLVDRIGPSLTIGWRVGTGWSKRGKEKEENKMSKLVMIVDDSLTVRKIIETSLKREGFDSVSFADGMEAMRAITEQRIRRIPDLIILDIGMPKMDGYAFARLLKSKPQFNHTVIIMLTSRDGVIDRLKGRLAGAKDYITKPFRTQELMDRLHLYLGVPTYT
jgi:twitching motility two-component system response regulator PilG